MANSGSDDITESTVDNAERKIILHQKHQILKLETQLKAKSYECSVWKKRAFQLSQEVK